MNRRTFLRSMVVVPAGIALSGGVAQAFSTYVEYGQLRVEIRSGTRLVATRYISLTSQYDTFSMNLTRSEVARIDRWDRLELRFAGGPCQVSSVEMETPPAQTLTTRIRARYV